MRKPNMNIATIRSGLNTNSLPDSTTLTVDVRTVPGIDHVYLCHSIQTLIGDMGKVRKIVDTPPLYSEPDEWAQSAYNVATPFIEGKPAPKPSCFDGRRGFEKRIRGCGADRHHRPGTTGDGASDR